MKTEVRCFKMTELKAYTKIDELLRIVVIIIKFMTQKLELFIIQK